MRELTELEKAFEEHYNANICDAPKRVVRQFILDCDDLLEPDEYTTGLLDNYSSFNAGIRYGLMFRKKLETDHDAN